MSKTGAITPVQFSCGYIEVWKAMRQRKASLKLAKRVRELSLPNGAAQTQWTLGL